MKELNHNDLAYILSVFIETIINKLQHQYSIIKQ